MTTKPQSTTETLEPCPFCKVTPVRRDHVYRYGSIAEHPEDSYCPIKNCTIGINDWMTCLSPASAAPVVDKLPVCPDCQQGYVCEHCGKPIGDYTAAATAAPVEQSETANYECDASPKCGWQSNDTSRPVSNGTKVNCPQCSGAARFVGMAPTVPPRSVQHLVNQWQAAWVSTQDISRDSETDLVRRIEAMLAARSDDSSTSARAAAEEINSYYNGLVGFNIAVKAPETVATIIKRHHEGAR